MAKETFERTKPYLLQIGPMVHQEVMWTKGRLAGENFIITPEDPIDWGNGHVNMTVSWRPDGGSPGEHSFDELKVFKFNSATMDWQLINTASVRASEEYSAPFAAPAEGVDFYTFFFKSYTTSEVSSAGAIFSIGADQTIRTKANGWNAL